jgi:hypothetical protein
MTQLPFLIKFTNSKAVKVKIAMACLLLLSSFSSQAQTNFSCATATPIPFTCYDGGLTATFNWSNPTSTMAACGPVVGITNAVDWYSFVGTGETYRVTGLDWNSGDPVFWILEGNCSALNCITANDDYNGSAMPLVEFPTTAGTTYYLAISMFAGSDYTFLFEQVTGTPGAQPTFATDTHVACDSFTWIDGNTYTSSVATGSGGSSFTYQTVNGCDSITYSLDLTINNSVSTADPQSVCENSTYTYPDGFSETITGNTSHTSVLTAANNCDSNVVTNVTMISAPQVSVSNNGPICPGIDAIFTLTGTPGATVNYTLNGTPLTTTLTGGISTITISAAATNQVMTLNSVDDGMCSQSTSLTSTVLLYPVYNIPENVTACQNSLYTYPDGFSETITASTSHTSNLMTINNCDSIIVTNVTMTPTYSTTINIVACENSSYTYPDGFSETITANTSHTSNLTSINNCDSIIITNVSVTLNGQVSITNNGPICEGVFGFFNLIGTSGATVYYTQEGNQLSTDLNGGSAGILVFNASTTQTVVLDSISVNDNMCTVPLSQSSTLIVHPVYNLVDNASVCSNTSYTYPDGFTEMITGNTTHTSFLNSFVSGCDSTIVTTVTMLPVYTSTDNVLGCQNTMYLYPDGFSEVITANTSHISNLSSTAGCDSIVTTNVTMTIPSFGTDTQIACDTYTWTDGNTYMASNNSATQIFTNAAGCDSLVTLDLTINNSTTGTDTQVACDTYTWMDGNTYTSSNNSATQMFTNAVGCDSLVTLDLTINNSTTGTDAQVACDTYTWIDGNTYTVSNNSATQMFTSALGCDSLVTLDLTINNSTTGTDTQVACDTYTWIDGNTYTSSNNSATQMFTSALGCDSLVTLDLTINNSTTGTDTQVACDTYTWVDGNMYTASNNSATQMFTTALGCDSLVTLDLTINNSTTGTDTQVACDTFTWVDGNMYTTSNNTATFTETNAVGCDSIITLDLTINSVDQSITQNGVTLTANQAGAVYQWIDCGNGNIFVTGQTSQDFTATINGDYAVIVTFDNCTDTSLCTTINNVGLNELYSKEFSVSPNPTNGSFTLDLNQSGLQGNISIMSSNGQVVYEEPIHGTNKMVINAQAWSNGVYFAHIKATQGNKVIKLVKQ